MEVAQMPFGPLLAALAEIRDPRRPQGQRYSLSHPLLFSVLAVLAGATSYQKIITFIAVQRDRLNTAFGAGLRRAPAVNTLRGLFLALDRDDLEGAFRRHARELNGAVPVTGKRSIALKPALAKAGGKTLRGSFDHLNDRAAAHVLSAFASDAALILAHREVAGAPGEIPAAPTLMTELGLSVTLLSNVGPECWRILAHPFLLRRTVSVAGQREERCGQETESGAVRAVTSRVRVRRRHHHGCGAKVWSSSADGAAGVGQRGAAGACLPATGETGAGAGGDRK